MRFASASWGRSVATVSTEIHFTPRTCRPFSAWQGLLLRLPPSSPKLNAYAERFVRSIKQECLRHLVPLGERHLRTVIRERRGPRLRPGAIEFWYTTGFAPASALLESKTERS